MFRLGDELVVRVPRREMAGRLVANEVAALPTLALRLLIPVPTPVRVGQPNGEYPYVWAVLPRLCVRSRSGSSGDWARTGDVRDVPGARLGRQPNLGS